MEHETILALIDVLNKGGGRDRIFLTPLTRDVDVGLAWTSEPIGRSMDESSHRIYFFKAADREYAGAVYDMIADIHVVVRPEYRRKGMAKRMMQEVVLPHLRSLGRRKQQTKLCSLEGAALAHSLGFRTKDGVNATLDLKTVGPWSYPEIPVPPIDAASMEAVRRRVGEAVECLRWISTALEGRASRIPMETLWWRARLIEDWLVAKDEAPVGPEYPEQPSRPPLGSTEQSEIEKAIYRSAAWLRMAADELQGRHDAARVDRLRWLAKQVIHVGVDIRDDWRDQQFRATLKS